MRLLLLLWKYRLLVDSERWIIVIVFTAEPTKLRNKALNLWNRPLLGKSYFHCWSPY